MSMTVRNAVFAFMIALMVGPAGADQYWVAYEGNDFPENEGWTRIIEGDGPAVRTLADGVLTIDSLRSRQIADFYRIDRQIDPAPGEEFVMRWRLRVNQVEGTWPYDPGVALFSDDDWGLGFEFGEAEIRSVFEHRSFALVPGVFHQFEVRSHDMRQYDLIVDGLPFFQGAFWKPAVTRSYVAWGDAGVGSASVAEWDYFEFGVVPEPTCQTLAVVVIALARCSFRLGRARWRRSSNMYS